MLPLRLTALGLAAAIALVPTVSEANSKDTLKLDLDKALDTFWNAPTHPDYIDENVEVDSDAMKQNIGCVNQSLSQVSGVMKDMWATDAYRKLGIYLIKSISLPMKAAGIDVSKATEIAQLALESTSSDELKEKLVQKLGEEAVTEIAGKKGAKVFDKIYEHYLPDNASPVQKKKSGNAAAGCIVDVEFTLTPPGKGRKANIRLEATTKACHATNAAAAAGEPRSYHLVAEADLVPDTTKDGTLGYAVGKKHYTLTGECGPRPKGLMGSGHLPFVDVEYATGSVKTKDLYRGRISISPAYAFHDTTLSLTLFAGVGREPEFFKQKRLEGDVRTAPTLVKYPEERIKAVRVKFDTGDKLEVTKTTGGPKEAGGLGYWFDIPAGAENVERVEVEVDLGGDASKTATWTEKELTVLRKNWR